MHLVGQLNEREGRDFCLSHCLLYCQHPELCLAHSNHLIPRAAAAVLVISETHLLWGIEPRTQQGWGGKWGMCAYGHGPCWCGTWGGGQGLAQGHG